MGFSSPIRPVAHIAAGLALLVALSAPLHGQSGATMLAEPPAPLLPQSLRTGPAHDAGSGAPSWAAVDAPILAEDGIRRYERGAPANAPAGQTVTVYQFEDATGAVAAWSWLHHPGGPEVIRNGVSVVVSTLRPSVETASLLKSVEVGLPKVGGTRGIAPLLPTLLPEKGLLKDSMKYAVGPAAYQATGGVLPPGIVGFDKAAESVTAKYQGRGTLTVLLYPTPELAGTHGRQIEAEMNKEGASAGTVKLRREGPLVLLTTGSWTPSQAEDMIHGIHLHNEVTWNKPIPPSFHVEVGKTYSLLASIAIFCGVGALAAIILGLFLGGGRALIRVLQGKPAASEPEFLRIDLSGRPTPLHTETPGPETRA